MNKYKLCRVYRHECGEVKPVDTDGNEYGNALFTYDNEPDYAYAIYENLGDNDYEDWEEYAYYDDDFMKAVEEYNKLKGDK